jgi:long-chain acyl-CoA synthetase
MPDPELLRARPWLRHYDSGVPHTIDYPAVPLQRLLDAAADRYPDRPAVAFFGRTLSYDTLHDLAGRCAGALRRLGVRPGDRVSLHLPNCPQFVIAYYATLKAGGVAVPVNPLFTEREAAQQIRDSGAVAAVTLDLFLDRVRAARAGSALAHIIVTRVHEFFHPVLRALYPLRAKRHGQWPVVAREPNTWWLADLLASPPVADPASQAPWDLAVLVYTGGTTGTPKGVMLTHGNLVANAYQTTRWDAEAADEKPVTTLGVLPLFHSYAMTVVMNSSLLRAGRMVLLPRFDAAAVLKTIARYHPDHLPGVPTLYNALIHHPQIARYDLRSVRTCISGAAPLPGEIQSQFERITGGRLVEGYGLTEASPVTHVTPLRGRRKPGSIGLPLPDTEARIVDLETGTRALPPGEAGELVIRGPQVMAGYWNRPDETAQTLRDGWLHTGDIATVDEDGYFAVIDRKKEMLITGGFNVYPREVEEVLYTHPAVLEAALVAVPDRHKGEVGRAFVVLKPGVAATAEELIAYCRERLAGYKVPAAIEFRDALPKSMIGKVLRRVLAEEQTAAPPQSRAAGG